MKEINGKVTLSRYDTFTVAIEFLHTSGAFDYVDTRALTHLHAHKHTCARARAHTDPIVYTGRRNVPVHFSLVIKKGKEREKKREKMRREKKKKRKKNKKNNVAKKNSHMNKETYLTTDFLTSRMSISHSTFRGTGWINYPLTFNSLDSWLITFNVLPLGRLVDDFVDGGFLVAGACHDVFIIGRNVAAQHRWRLFRLEIL